MNAVDVTYVMVRSTKPRLHAFHACLNGLLSDKIQLSLSDAARKR